MYLKSALVGSTIGFMVALGVLLPDWQTPPEGPYEDFYEDSAPKDVWEHMQEWRSQYGLEFA